MIVPGTVRRPGAERVALAWQLCWRANPATLRFAMSGAPEPPLVTKSKARQIWLRAQRLDAREPFGAGAQAVAAAVAHLGYVQIDTINVVERCHHHILYSRIPSYRRADLRHAQSVDKSVFEYWTHALSYVPTQDFRFFLPAMRRHQRERNEHRRFKSVTPAAYRKQILGMDQRRNGRDS